MKRCTVPEQQLRSPPSRWCGLKYDDISKYGDFNWSPPSRWCGLKFCVQFCISKFLPVTTFAVVWIEIKAYFPLVLLPRVTTFAVVWIEMEKRRRRKPSSRVTTFAVVWIEMSDDATAYIFKFVTTFAVVWIEIFPACCRICHLCLSPPSRWCGLK